MNTLWAKLKSLLPAGRFARSVALVGGGTAAGQALVALVSPVITRLYTPEDFGIFAVYASVINIAMVLVSWKYELAIPLPEEDRTALDIVGLVVVLSVVMSALSAVLIWLGGDALVAWLEAPRLRPYLWIVPLNLLVGGVYETLLVWAIRKKAFAVIARSKLAQAGSLIALQVGLGLARLGPLGLVLGHVARWTGGGSALARLLPWRGENGLLAMRAAGLRAVAKRYCRFPLFTMWSALLNTASAQVPALLLTAFFNSATAGLYSLTGQVLWMPVSFVTRAVSQVFLSTAAEANRRGTTAEVARIVFNRLTGIGLPFILLLAIVAPEAFGFIFGAAWTEAGRYARWLCPWLLLTFVTAGMSSLVFVLEHQRGELIFQVILLVGRVLALVGGGLYGSDLAAIASYGLFSFVCWTFYLMWLFSISGNRPLAALVCLLTRLTLAAPMMVPVLTAKLVSDNLWVVAGGAAASAGWAVWRVMNDLRGSRKIENAESHTRASS